MAKQEQTLPLTQQLRLGTHHLHDSLEQSTQLPQSLLGLRELRTVLYQFLCVYKPLDEVLLTQSLREVASIPKYVARSNIILSDLAELSEGRQQLTSIAEIQFPTTLSSFQKLGMRYVVEGSVLGGRIIRKHIDSSEWVPSANSCMQFFSINEELTGCKWRDFTAAFDSIDCSNAQREEALSGATLLYKMLITSFAINSAQATPEFSE